MLNPSIGKLIRAYGNRYQLVLDVARLARNISEDAEKDKIIMIEKPVNIATDKIASSLRG